MSLVLAVACSAPETREPPRPSPPVAPLLRDQEPPPPAPLDMPEPSAPATGVPTAVTELGSADLDPHNDAVVAPPDSIPDCAERLTRAGIRFDAAELRVRKLPGGGECGAPEVVTYRGPQTGAVRWNARPLVSCGMALALGRFESVLGEVSEQELGSRVVKLEQGGTYSCRKMSRFALVSEHSYANAIDIRSFRLSDGRSVSVERHFGRPGAEPRGAEGRFLRALARRLYDDGIFSVVLTEYFDRLHRDHFHLDLARYRVDGTR